MDDLNPQSTAKIAGHPLHPMLIPFPVAFFVGTLAADIAYSQTGDAFWAEAGRWLLGAGLVMAALAAVAGLTDFLGDRRVRALSAAWQHMIGNVVVVLIELFSLWQRLALGAEFVVPVGLTLSLVVTLLLLFTGWKGWDMVYRHHVAITDRRVDEP